jgi:hypothetical protein
LACQGELFVNNPLDVKENDEHALDFAFHLSHLLRSALKSIQFKRPCTAHACLIIAKFLVALFPIFAQNLMHTVPLLDASGQIHDSK